MSNKTEVKYERKGSNIKDLENGDVMQHKSINLAKQKSRQLQEANGGLGAGSLVVVQ